MKKIEIWAAGACVQPLSLSRRAGRGCFMQLALDSISKSRAQTWLYDMNLSLQPNHHSDGVAGATRRARPA